MSGREALQIVCTGVLVLLGCGGSSGGSVGASGSDAGSDSPLLPTGTCTLDLSGALMGALSGTGVADMDGSGNLIITCTSFSSAVGATLTLNVGNGTYDGQGTYDIDMSLSHGAVTYAPSANDSYMAMSPAAGCVVTVTQAPQGNYDQPGTSVGGTFACQSLTDVAGQSLGIASGVFQAPVR